MPLNRHSYLVFVTLAGLLTPLGSPHAQDTTPPLDRAFRLVTLAGMVKERAKLCNAPTWSYDQTLKEAEALLPTAFSEAGFPATEAQSQELIVQHIADDMRVPPQWCDGFRRVVSVLGAQVDKMEGRHVRAKALYDRPDWREHPDRAPDLPAPRELPLKVDTSLGPSGQNWTSARVTN